MRVVAAQLVGHLDPSYTPPLGSPWEALQTAAQRWTGALTPAITTMESR